MELINSKRLLYTASYVSTRLTADEQKAADKAPGSGYPKANLLRALNLSQEDLDRIRASLDDRSCKRSAPEAEQMERMFSIAQRLASKHPSMSTRNLATALAPISYSAMKTFIGSSSHVSEKSKFWVELADEHRKISPIGRLHLERLEMYPAGVQKGELIFTVPMAPGETITISHKEWSTSSREFEEIVQDYFESFSEKGVAEKSDASMSSENESKHSSGVNFGATMTGSYGGVTLTTTLGLTKTSEERESAKVSMQRNREITVKASARTRKEHKVSVKVETKSGTEDISAKTFSNDAKVPIRLDYYRMMRKWRTDLLRYGLRQTYDLVIPLPGVRLWAYHQQILQMDKQLRSPVPFTLKPQDINRANYANEAVKSGTTVQDPPPEHITDYKYVRIGYFNEEDSDMSRYEQIEIEVPEAYAIASSPGIEPKLEAQYALWPDHGSEWAFTVYGASQVVFTSTNTSALLTSLYGKSGRVAVVYKHRYVSTAAITVALTYRLSDDAYKKWQIAAWAQLRAAAEARHNESMQRVQEERDRVWRLLNGKDTLSLRRLEREELIRLVMQWLLGPEFPLVSKDYQVEGTLMRLLANEEEFRDADTHLKSGPVFPLPPPITPTFGGITADDWEQTILFGEQVKLIHQAIEWENILYFLYPYFWGSESVGRDKLLFEHADPEHERFLRAGYARIVLTVRPGFEEAFTDFMETGLLPGISDVPYVTASQEIANFARTNFAGIPPANPELHARPLLYPEQRATWATMQALFSEIDAYKAASALKAYPDKLSDLTTAVPLVDAWGNAFVYRHPGLGADYDLISLGADGKEGGEGLDADISSLAGASLVATWFDYTPTSGIDIELNTKLEDMA